MELKKLVLLCQHKVHMKSTTWSEIQDSTISSALNFSFLRILLQSKRKRSNCNKHNRKKNGYIGNQYHCYFGLPKIRVGRASTTK